MDSRFVCDRTKYVAYFGPLFLFSCIVFVYFCVTYGLDMFDYRHLSIFGVEVKTLDFRAKRGLKVQKRAELGNKCGLVRFPTALDPHFVPNPRPWKNRARAIVRVSASWPPALRPALRHQTEDLMLWKWLSAGECGSLQPHSTRTPAQIREPELKKWRKCGWVQVRVNHTSPALHRVITKFKSKCDLFWDNYI